MTYDILVFIGRFSPFHDAHLAIIEHACTIASEVVVIIGSTNNERTLKNPFTGDERENMILRALSDEQKDKVIIEQNYDTPEDDEAWVFRTKELVGLKKIKCMKIGLIGHEKDVSSAYLKWFPEWDFIDVDAFPMLHATDIRNIFFTENFDPMDFANNVPISTFEFLLSFSQTPEYTKLLQQQQSKNILT